MGCQTSILILDHDVNSRTLLTQVAERLGWKVRVADSPLDALGLLDAVEFQIVIADLDAAGLDGIEVLRRARRDHPAVDAVVIVSPDAAGKADEAVRLGIPDFLVRPFGLVEAKRVLSRLAEKRPETSDDPHVSPQAQEALARLVGNTPAMLKVKSAIRKAAESRMPVLILGESGTGKELVARAIHACGQWRDEPFLPVDCGSLSPTLIESELFGHVRGAFTGATQPRVGLLAAAGKGTLVLDEIGELPVELQAKLLRAIQEREVRPVGANQSTPLEARIVAATNINMKEAIRDGSFRQDLYYRLNVFTIRIPPLRERRADVLPLVHHFLERHGSAEGVADFSPDFMNRLMQYDWPGNVRELENSVQRALALSSGVRLEVKDLPSTVVYGSQSRSARRDSAKLQDLERRAIKEALEAVGGDRTRAAKLLGIGKTTIYRKLKEYGLDDDAEPVTLTD